MFLFSYFAAREHQTSFSCTLIRYQVIWRNNSEMGYSCEQNQGESIDSYITRLRKFASSCEFGTLTDELIREKLVIGLNNRGTKGKLFLREISQP